MRFTRQVLLAAIVALALPFPADGYPAGRALWDLALGDTGHVPRLRFAVGAAGVIAIYMVLTLIALTLLEKE